MVRFLSFSAWRYACGIAWILILGLIGLTVAEMTQFGGIVQFYGDSLTFVWEDEGTAHHYRIHLTGQNYTGSETVLICSTLYSQEPMVQIETLPGYAYSLRVQAVSAAGDTSVLSDESQLFLCLGNSETAGSESTVFLPNETTLGPNYPNPFNSTTTIPYTIASADGSPIKVSLKIYNTAGRAVRQLVDKDLLPGQYHAIWNGRNDNGTVISAGNYICMLKAENFNDTRLITFIK